MRIIVDLLTDRDGRPVGTVHIARQDEEPFSDWLDLLRLLERCIDEQREREALTTDNQPGPP